MDARRLLTPVMLLILCREVCGYDARQMKTQSGPDFTKWPSPVAVLGESAFISLAGAGISIIITAKAQVLWAREMTSFLVCPFLAFTLLYGEYKIAEALLKRELDRRFGYAQSLGCLVIAFYGLAAVLSTGLSDSPVPAGLSERVLLLLCLFGEVVFIANIIWTFKAENAPQVGQSVVSTRSPQVARASIPQRGAIQATLPQSVASDWTNSPTGMFAIAAVFFAVMGTALAKVGFLVSQVPVGWNGSTTQVPAGYLCASTALPFAAFALLYFILESHFGMRFPLSSTRVHFVCTLLAVLETIHVYLGWASTWANTGSLNKPVTSGDFGGAFAFGALAFGCLAWNVVASRRDALGNA